MKASESVLNKMSIIKAMLEENDLLTEADEINLDLLEQEFIIYEKCNEDIEKYGITMKDTHGGLKANPALNLRNKSANTILNILKEFCISSKSRKLLLMKDIDGEEKESPLSTYMKSLNIR